MKKQIAYFVAVTFVCSCMSFYSFAQPLPLEVAECQDFFYSLSEGNIELVKKCLKNRPDLLYKTNSNSKTALMIAAEAGQAKIVAYLVKQGANVAATDLKGKSAIHYAAICYNYKTLNVLIDAGANINIKDNEGKTPIHIAILNNRTENIDYLLNNDADITILDFDGKSANDYISVEL